MIGDIIVNPYVSKITRGTFTHKQVINPQYILIRAGHEVFNYKGELIDMWDSDFYNWEVIGHIDLYSYLRNSIVNAFEDMPLDETFDMDTIISNTEAEEKAKANQDEINKKHFQSLL